MRLIYCIHTDIATCAYSHLLLIPSIGCKVRSLLLLQRASFTAADSGALGACLTL
jgi:hypothetical protein